MAVPKVITSNARSESMKKTWARRKAEQEEKDMNMSPPIKAWVYHSEWFVLMATVIGCFVFCFRETVHTNDRLDGHMEAINRRTDQISADTNRRCDELNKRSDDLHREFYDLLKEMRK